MSQPTEGASAGTRDACVDERLERLATWLAGPPLAFAIAFWLAFQVASWAPHYLTWPWWADHDVFATAARGWDAGRLPYRDLAGNNFPGTVYLFYGLGKLFGWGQTAPFWAADLALLVGFAVLTLAWSRRTLGGVLPGLVALVAVLGYYLDLDYSQAGQRDWQAPLLGLASVMAVGMARGWGVAASAVLFGLALSIRPQVAVMGPAVFMALRPNGDGTTRDWLRRAGAWSGLVGLVVAAWLLPLARAGILDDFLRGIRMAAYGGSYNQASPAAILREFAQQGLELRYGLVVVLLVVLGWGTKRQRWVVVSLIAIAGVWLYRPTSPVQHAYLAHPLRLTWAWSLAVLAAVVLEQPGQRATVRLALLGLLLAVAGPGWPRFCNPTASVRVVRNWLGRSDSIPRPPGYAINRESASAGRYDWDDYKDSVGFLKHELKPGTRVANALQYTPALVGPTGRLPALPAESIAWLTIVDGTAEPRFVEAIEEAKDAVVVWDPSEAPSGPGSRLHALQTSIQRHYEPWVQFGVIEVWRRKGEGLAVARHTPQD